MDNEKLERIESFKQWLQDNDVSFVEKANGHFQIFDALGKLVFQVWATTCRMNVQTSGTTVIGLERIEKTIEDFLGTDKNADDVASYKLPDYLSPARREFIVAVEKEKENGERQPFTECVLVVVVETPTGAKEVIMNHQDIESKVGYYMDAYDDSFRLKSNRQVRILGTMLV